MKELSDSILVDLERKKENCTICNGTGYLLQRDGDSCTFQDCKCIMEIGEQIAWLRGAIPKQYWYWDLSQLTDKFKGENPQASKYIYAYSDKLAQHVENGDGFWLSSSPGLAKSSIICYLLRKASRLGYRVYWTRASRIISKKFEAMGDDVAREYIRDIIDNVHVLAIEEIEKVRLMDDNAMINHLFFELLSDIYDSKKVVFLTSNEPRKQVLPIFPTFIQDRLRCWKYLPLVGKYSGRHG